MKTNIDLTGKTFNNIKVIGIAGKTRSNNYIWLCKCHCGIEKTFSQDHLTRKSAPVKSCGCLRKRKGKNSPFFNGIGEISGGWWHNKITRERKGNRKLEVTITKEYAWDLFLKQNKKCALSGIELTIAHKGNASIDRIDNSKGYIIDNIQWVDKNINFMKRILTQEFFIEMCKKVANYN